MITPQTLRHMSATTRTAAFEHLAEQVYGTDRFKTALATDIDVTSATVHNWIRENKTPFAVILLMQEWAQENNRSTAMLRHWGAITADLASLAHNLEKLNRVTKAIAREKVDSALRERGTDPASAQCNSEPLPEDQ